VRHGNVYLRCALTQAATSACKVKGSHFRDKYLRIERRRGKGRAVFATAHALLVAVYHMLKSGDDYRERGPHTPTDSEKKAIARRLTKRIEQLGYDVELKPKVAA
jgi:hypothetical protein